MNGTNSLQSTKSPYTIDKVYTQIGNVNCLHNIFEPFAALF